MGQQRNRSPKHWNEPFDHFPKEVFWIQCFVFTRRHCLSYTRQIAGHNLCQHQTQQWTLVDGWWKRSVYIHPSSNTVTNSIWLKSDSFLTKPNPKYQGLIANQFKLFRWNRQTSSEQTDVLQLCANEGFTAVLLSFYLSWLIGS